MSGDYSQGYVDACNDRKEAEAKIYRDAYELGSRTTHVQLIKGYAAADAEYRRLKKERELKFLADADAKYGSGLDKEPARLKKERELKFLADADAKYGSGLDKEPEPEGDGEVISIEEAERLWEQADEDDRSRELVRNASDRAK